MFRCLCTNCNGVDTQLPSYIGFRPALLMVLNNLAVTCVALSTVLLDQLRLSGGKTGQGRAEDVVEELHIADVRGDLADGLMLTCDKTLHSLGQILQQVPTVSDLYGLGCPLA